MGSLHLSITGHGHNFSFLHLNRFWSHGKNTHFLGKMLKRDLRGSRRFWRFLLLRSWDPTISQKASSTHGAVHSRTLIGKGADRRNVTWNREARYAETWSNENLPLRQLVEVRSYTLNIFVLCFVRTFCTKVVVWFFVQICTKNAQLRGWSGYVQNCAKNMYKILFWIMYKI